MTYAVQCTGCGQSFIAKRPHARYCSDACRARVWRGEGDASRESGGERVLGHLRQPTDCERIATALRVRGSIHSHDIRRLALSGHPSERIRELEAQGWVIEHVREHRGRRPGMLYVLISEPGSMAEAA